MVEFLRYRLRAGDNLEDFVDHMAEAVDAPTVKGCKSVIWAVRAGRRAMPKDWELPFARWLRLEPGSRAWKEFHRLVVAGRAWGKSNGREHLEHLERELASMKARNSELAAENNRLRRLITRGDRRLTDSEAELAAVVLPDPKGEPETLRPD
jgi:hypothetical protein